MHLRILAVAVAAAALVGCSASAPANVAATVNGRNITFAELEKQYQVQFPTPAERPSDDQKNIQKLELLRTMVDSEIMLQRAEKLGLLAADAEVDSKLGEMKSGYTQEEFSKQLEARKLSLEDLRTQLRRDLSIQKLFNKEITANVNITDQEVADFYNQNKSAFNLPEPQVHMAQIVVTSNPDPNVRNLKNDKAQNDEQARKKILMIESRLKQGEDFGMLAQNYSEDPASAANGGDLGFIPESSLEKANVELRRLVMSLPSGGVSQVIRGSGGYQILKVVSKEPSGQRELTDPRVQQNIRETLVNRKDQLLKAAYFEVARNEAKVTNHFAAKVVQEKTRKK
ncbi:MAG: peptidylprolyl isomerase [Acidobacteria bacterium]|nr:peptidylprolyl isomerase [Acidobacteriota bacterium]